MFSISRHFKHDYLQETDIVYSYNKLLNTFKSINNLDCMDADPCTKKSYWHQPSFHTFLSTALLQAMVQPTMNRCACVLNIFNCIWDSNKIISSASKSDSLVSGWQTSLLGWRNIATLLSTFDVNMSKMV